MPIENFDIKLAQSLGHDLMCAYISKFFYPMKDGNHIIIEDGKPKVLSQETIKKVYFARLGKAANEYYFHKNPDLMKIVCKLNRPILAGNEINVCPQFKHKCKPYLEFDPKVRAGVDRMLKYILDVWADKKKDVHKYLIDWFANMCRGFKNTSILYCKSIQGVGKSTLTEFLMTYVVGSELSLMSGSEPIKTRFNSTLLAKVLVVFEELENSGVSEWRTISSNLRRHATEPMINIESKGIDSYPTDNINNYIINTNENDAIKDPEGRRFFPVEFSTFFKGNFQYFKELREMCFNDAVGEAFFSYLNEIDLTTYNAQEFPETNSKTDAVINRLDSVYLFLKNVYILKNKSIVASMGDLYGGYVQFCDSKSLRLDTKIQFNQKLKDINIFYFKSNTMLKYNIPHCRLYEIAVKDKWINELDEYAPLGKVINTETNPTIIENLQYDHGIETNDYSISSNGAKMSHEIKLLKQEIISLKAKDPMIKYKQIVRDFNQCQKRFLVKPIIRKTITQSEINTVYDLFN